jgi:outer membrane immunogenic protein
MKRFLQLACAGLFAATMAAPSFAADLPRPSYKAPVYVAPFSWSGFYIGINGGYGWGHTDWNLATGNQSFNTKGAFVGGTLGYNLQTGSFVWGLEADVQASWMDGLNMGAAGTPCAPPNGCETKNTWFGTGRGRIGYAWDRFLPYITGGAAFGNIKMTPNSLVAEDKTNLGWAVGAGVEWAFWSNWSAKVEYLYMDLGSVTCGAAACGVDTDVSWKTNLVRLGVNYRF